MKTVREWRAERLLGVKALALKSGVSNKTIVQIEHGRQVANFRTIRRLCDALGVEPGEVTEFAAAIAQRAAGPDEAAGKEVAAA